ncbi:MAG: hypothetical protein KKG59_02260 [Nanoarchaeota archaeon]|nr:hypothetical protein [Nanoarchaeota archaeon]
MKKGQAALEFLITYGWAIVTVLVALGALAYYQVLTPGDVLPSTCQVSPGFGCKNYKATEKTIEFTLLNGMVGTIKPVKITFRGDVEYCSNFDDSLYEDLCTGQNQESCVILGQHEWIADDEFCDDGECSITVQRPAQIGHEIVHVMFMNCNIDGDVMKDRVNVELEIEYDQEGESVQHSADGKLSLKIEKLN